MTAPALRHRVAVIGPSGSGKSTLAAELAERQGTTRVDLDELFHGPDWAETPTPEFRRRVMEALTAAEDDTGGWAVAGNYLMTADIVHRRADTIVWLDLPRRRTITRVIRRSVRRAVRREQLWNSNRERWRDLLRPSRSIVVEAWRKHPGYAAKYSELAQTPLWANADVVRVRSTADLEAFLGSLS